ncbi:hypothetical protein JCM1841_005884 [Sporobolomyces salmonicolor]
MGLFEHDSEQKKAYAEVVEQGKHQGHLSHEMIASAAAYEAAKKYEEHCGKYGKPASHQKAKELLAGFSAAAADKLIETKGLNHLDKARAQQAAQQQADEALAKSGQF